MIEKEDLLKAASLSRLEVSDEKIDSLLLDMENILSFAAQIENAHFVGESFSFTADAETVFRSDEVKNSVSADEVLENAFETADGFFFLRKGTL